MSDQRPSPFREFESPAVQEYRRQNALARDLRSRFEALGLSAAYTLFRHKVFAGWATPPLTDDGRNRQMLRPPEYPEQAEGEDGQLHDRRHQQAWAAKLGLFAP